MRQSEDRSSEFHHGLGTWIRNEWGLLKREGALYQQLKSLGFVEPDAMSAAILTSFWRRTHGLPIDLDAQVAKFREMDEEMKKYLATETERARVAKIEIQSMLLGVSEVPSRPTTLRLPARQSPCIQVRSLAAFRDGVVVGVRHWSQSEVGFPIRPYFLSPADGVLRPVQIPEFDEVSSFVILGDRLWVLGSRAAQPALIVISPTERLSVSFPRTGVPVQLGDGEAGPLLLYSDAIYQFNGNGWDALVEGLTIPAAGPPPVKRDALIYLRSDVNSSEYLWLLDLRTKRIVRFHQEMGFVGFNGPPWENVSSYTTSSDGKAWIATTHGSALLQRGADGRYRVAVVNGSTTFDGEVLKDPDEQRLRISAITTEPREVLTVAGRNGLYQLSGTSLTTLATFENTEQQIPTEDSLLQWAWDPAQMLRIGETRFLMADMYRGMFVVDISAEHPAVQSVDESIGAPIRF